MIGENWRLQAEAVLRSYYLGATTAELCEWYGIPDRNAFYRLRLLYRAPARPPRRTPEAAEPEPSAPTVIPEKRLIHELDGVTQWLRDLELHCLADQMGPVLPVI